jgi:hypothetical protein
MQEIILSDDDLIELEFLYILISIEINDSKIKKASS